MKLLFTIIMMWAPINMGDDAVEVKQLYPAERQIIMPGRIPIVSTCCLNIMLRAQYVLLSPELIGILNALRGTVKSGRKIR